MTDIDELVIRIATRVNQAVILNPIQKTSLIAILHEELTNGQLPVSNGRTMTDEWWLCPNEPRCPHGAILHDIYDYEDTSPRCCADGCDCGRTDAPSPGMMSGYPSVTEEP